VLDLLRRGRSNREIAGELGISLAGAKYHVSQIISKLGVSSREEAASWRTGAPRWGFAPLATLSRGGFAFVVSLPVKTYALASVVVFALGLFALLGGDPGAGRPFASAPTPTPEPCPVINDSPAMCNRIIHDQLASWDEARQVAPFAVREPWYIPAEWRRHRLIYSHIEAARGGRSPWDTISAEYVNEDGRVLRINQGYGIGANLGWYALAPDEHRGTLQVAGTLVSWSRGAPVYEMRNGAGYPTDRWDPNALDGAIVLTWEASGPGLLVREVSPDGEERLYQGGLRVGYAIIGELPFEELARIAESMIAR
jgi:hypothetical protein